jgi:hypothetical protein
MKLHFLPSIAAASLIMLLPVGANAQEKQQKKLHIVIEENGTVTKDTSVTFDKSLSENEVQEIISDITGETPHPCPAHKYHVMHGDTMVNKCGHMKKGELDSLLEASGHSYKHPDTDSCGHSTAKAGSQIVWTEKAEIEEGSKGDSDVKVIIVHGSPGEESVIVEEDGDVVIINKGHGQEKKCLKEISEGERAEKTIIMESPEKTEKSEKKQK